MIKSKIICESIGLSRGNKLVLDSASLTILGDEQILLSGIAGSGKTSFALAIAGQAYVSGQIEINYDDNEQLLPQTIFIPQHYNFKNKFGLNEFYYQQRYNSYDSEDSITLIEAIDQESKDQALAKFLIGVVGMEHRLHAPLIQLSSGERKKLQLILAFLKPAQVMILDNPYIGLDVDSVAGLNAYMSDLAQTGVTFILISDTVNIPSFITHLVTISDCKLDKVQKSTVIIGSESNVLPSINYELAKPDYHGSDQIIHLNKVTVRYGDKIVLNEVNWTVNKGDKWLLNGHNGAGKSTLLSLITGDNPQAYANELYLFGKRRGSGETIWDIKRNIGFVSPELHWSFTTQLSCLNTVISGFFDTPGLYTKATEEQVEVAKNWLTKFELSEYLNHKFGEVSTGIQRVLLLLRALVKNPPLFIFDEPCQGLDEYHTKKFTNMVDSLFADSDHTIIYISHRPDQIPDCINKSIRLSAGVVVS